MISLVSCMSLTSLAIAHPQYVNVQILITQNVLIAFAIGCEVCSVFIEIKDVAGFPERHQGLLV